MRLTKVFAVVAATFTVSANAAAINPASFAPGAQDVVISGAAYSNLLQVLGVTDATAAKLGLVEGQTAGQLANEVSNLLDQKKRREFIGEEAANAGADAIVQRDLISTLSQIPLSLLSDALNLLVTGGITAYDELLSVLGINATVANELGLLATETTSELINLIAKLIEQAIENGFLSAKRDLAPHTKVDSKRDLIGTLSQIPLDVLSGALNLLVTGGISTFDELISYLGVNTTEANELGLLATQTISGLVNQVVKLVEDAIENGFLSAKRDTLTDDLSQIPLELLTQALHFLVTGAISGFDDLLGFLGINATEANELGLLATQTISGLVNQVAKLVEDAIENGFLSAKRDTLTDDLSQIPLALLTAAVNAIVTGGILTFDQLISWLGISPTVANKLGLFATQTISELLNQLIQLVETSIENGFKNA